MFDVGFLELVVIMVLGLLVLGPERLPKAAQKVGYWFGKARRYVEGMKEQVEAEFDGAEVKRLLHNQEVQIRELQDKITETESYIDTEYHNQFDDADDPGTSPEIAEETKPNELAREPQYDIIEEDEAWADDSHSNQTLSEQKQSEAAQQTASANQPDENQSADNHASGNKAQ
ncbi:Twin-arginine translocation protein TatB [hydrothermal vent metagenome]|uniref:Twin-arginine translocation protein TatB n=1 Tax=hydrothermal vent metagenome TaxID=652676 RepID=A0A3B0WW23_9ZZZZ